MRVESVIIEFLSSPLQNGNQIGDKMFDFYCLLKSKVINNNIIQSWHHHHYGSELPFPCACFNISIIAIALLTADAAIPKIKIITFKITSGHVSLPLKIAWKWYVITIK